jgi:hypothetical protein
MGKVEVVNYIDSNLHSWPDIRIAITPKMNKLEERTGIREITNAYKISVGKPGVKKSLGRPKRRMRIILKRCL